MPDPSTVEEYTPAFVQRVFPFLTRATLLDIALWQWVGIAVALGGALLCGYLLTLAITRILRGVFRQGDSGWRFRAVRASRGPIAVLLALAVFRQVLGFLHLVGTFSAHLEFAIRLCVIVAVAWLALRVVRALLEGVEVGIPGVDELSSRGLRTQLVVLNRIASGLIVAIAGATVLSQFESVRQLGVSLLASAGIAGIVFGLAAQRSLGTLLQGIQLSLAQPVRIGDAVFMEGEYGRVEQIYLTYVVLRLWDRRRLIVPTGRFLEQPFQNWSLAPHELRGAVELFVDFSTPIDRVRAELKEVVRTEPLWNHDYCELQAIDSSATAVKLRCVVSARSPDDLFDLRCSVRERMLAFLQQLDDGYHLPVTRSVNLAQVKGMAGLPPPDETNPTA